MNEERRRNGRKKMKRFRHDFPSEPTNKKQTNKNKVMVGWLVGSKRKNKKKIQTTINNRRKKGFFPST